MGSARRRRSRKDYALREVAREHLCTALPQCRASGRYDTLVGAISGAVAVSKTQGGKEMKPAQLPDLVPQRPNKTGGTDALLLMTSGAGVTNAVVHRNNPRPPPFGGG